MNINKNLLSLVLKKEVMSSLFVREFKEMKNFLSISFKDGTTGTENIYDIENKCKDFIVEEGFSISSGRNKDGGFCTISKLCQKFIITNGSTELEAVFKALEEFKIPKEVS